MSDAPRLTSVGVRSGSLVDQVIFCFSDQSQTVWGHTGGSVPVVWKIQEGDYLVQINVRQGTRLDAIQFKTAQGQESPFYGGKGGNAKEFCVEDGCEIVGLLLHRERYFDYAIAKGSVDGLCTRPVGGVVPPTYVVCDGTTLCQLDAGCSPENGYSYDGKDDFEINTVVYRSDLEDALKHQDLDPKVRAAIIKILDFPGSQFVGKQLIAQVIKGAMVPVSTMTGEAVPIGLITHLKTNGFMAGMGGFVRESLQKNNEIMGCLAGVLLAHIAAPIYAVNGHGEEATKLAGSAMIGLGAAIVVGGAAAFAIGLIAAPVIGGIFTLFGESSTELEKRWKTDMVDIYKKVSQPLGTEISKRKSVKCPNGHPLVDNGPPPLPYLGDLAPFRQGCSAGFGGSCTSKESRWQFRTVRMYCSSCAVCYCEPCLLAHLKEGKSLPARVLWK